MWKTIQDNVLEISLVLIVGVAVGASKNWTFIVSWIALFSMYVLFRFKRSY